MPVSVIPTGPISGKILTIIYGPGAYRPALSSKQNVIVSFPGPSLMIGFPVFSEVWDQTYNGKVSADVRR